MSCKGCKSPILWRGQRQAYWVSVSVLINDFDNLLLMALVQIALISSGSFYLFAFKLDLHETFIML